AERRIRRRDRPGADRALPGARRAGQSGRAAPRILQLSSVHGGGDPRRRGPARRAGGERGASGADRFQLQEHARAAFRGARRRPFHALLVASTIVGAAALLPRLGVTRAVYVALILGLALGARFF